MPLSAKLDRKLRAAEESSDEEDYYEVTDRSSSASVIETGAEGEILSSDSQGEEEEGYEDEQLSDAGEDEQVQAQMSKVSFGALTKAQEAISKEQLASRKRKRGEDLSKSQDDKLQALRARLREIKAAKLAQGPSGKKLKTTAKSKPEKRAEEDDEDEGDSEDDEGDSDSDTAPHTRSSKHAPAVQSSKRAVSRKRNIMDVKKPIFRDPRFDNVSGPRPTEDAMNKRYSFLNDYRASEMAELRATIKKTKNEDEKEKLKKKLLSMESQQKTREAKEKQQEIVRDHRKKEKELVKQGKQPFYLKKSEQKKLALIDRFQNMKSKQRDKVIERRRKKVASKERRNMPMERRGA